MLTMVIIAIIQCIINCCSFLYLIYLKLYKKFTNFAQNHHNTLPYMRKKKEENVNEKGEDEKKTKISVFGRAGFP